VLRAEFASGKRELAQMQNKEAALKQTLERISGAIKEIEEN
jgi:hypothetical protein